MQEEKLKLEDLIGPSSSPDQRNEINNVAIIGAGVMGRGIGQTISSNGMEVLIVEKNEQELDNAKRKLSESIDREISGD